jgi:electron transport complex protein RnfD|tara:strand:+ start:303 stop:1325 length:1023 start_codon:yes stop_codon:yes gene_type:complete
MLWVIAACLPGIAASTWFFGWGLLLNILVVMVFAVLLEAVMLKLADKPVKTHLADNSALVTGLILGIAIPPGSPWWLLFTGICFAIVVAKHLYGGLGQNPFNPAMCGYLLLLLSFPLNMTTWHLPTDTLFADQQFSPLSWTSLQYSLQLCFPALAGDGSQISEYIDGFAMATPLIEYKLAGNSTVLAALENNSPLFARASETGWEIINFSFLLGGLFLLFKKIIGWQIPVSIIVTITIMSLLFYEQGSTAVYGTTYLHLFGSATMIGAFFIATDPVSAATTPGGRVVYGIFIGIAIYGIRVWGSYLDSIAIAVLFGNFCAPLLDHFCRPRIYGHSTRPSQ